MTTLATQYVMSADATFVQRVTVAVVNAAIAISSEATSTADHANRIALAKTVLANALPWGQDFALGVIANQAVDDPSTITDAAIQSTVNALWNGFAGVL